MIYYLFSVFYVYSFVGWIAENIYASYHQKKFVNRGVLGGPLCCIYGFVGVAVTLLFHDLHNHWIFLVIACGVVSGFIEWISGKFLERIYHRKWWDYSHQRFNLDGYVSLLSVSVWGISGAIAVLFINPWIMILVNKVPKTVSRITLWIMIALTVIDAVWTYCAMLGLRQKLPKTEKIHSQMVTVSIKLHKWILKHTQNRLEKAYPKAHTPVEGEEKVFARGCGFYKIFLLFVIGSFLGDIIETIFCRITIGVWMSRSSLVWGPFSVVWGLAIALATLILYNYRNKSDGELFLFGTVLGGVYEYSCSVFTQIVFGKIFWDYSAIPFNLGGRINLLYCFFWGIAAVVWLKRLFPLLSNLIERIPLWIGQFLTIILCIFMVINVIVSCLALYRSRTRNEGMQASNVVEEFMDEHYSDEVLKKIYPNSIEVPSKIEFNHK